MWTTNLATWVELARLLPLRRHSSAPVAVPHRSTLPLAAILLGIAPSCSLFLPACPTLHAHRKANAPVKFLPTVQSPVHHQSGEYPLFPAKSALTVCRKLVA